MRVEHPRRARNTNIVEYWHEAPMNKLAGVHGATYGVTCQHLKLIVVMQGGGGTQNAVYALRATQVPGGWVAC